MPLHIQESVPVQRFFKKTVESDLFSIIFITAFIIFVGISAVVRNGKDLNVDLFGAEQALQKKSPYYNPGDPSRPLFRYAPPFALMVSPFLLNSKRVDEGHFIGKYEYRNITASVISFYTAKVFLLFLSVMMLFKMMDAVPIKNIWLNFKTSFFLSAPFIGYELANNQNKLIALSFVIFSLFLLSRNRLWLSGLFFNFALAVYLPLAPFMIYFLKKEKRFILSFLATALLVFVICPSLIWGFKFNNFLLKDWFERCIRPFFATNSYATYIDLRMSSQSLPSAIGRIFARADAGNFRYLISPVYIHMIIRILSFLISSVSFFAIWFSTDRYRGLQISVLLILAMVLPSYCIYYTWAYLLIIYFYVLSYIRAYGGEKEVKITLLAPCILLFLVMCLLWVKPLKYSSVLFWSTLVLWLGMIRIMLQDIDIRAR